MPAFELIGSYKHNPGGTMSECAAFTGQSLQVRATQAPVHLEQLWSENATGGAMRVHSPRMHDTTNGIRSRVDAATPQPLLPYRTRELMYELDTMTVETTGGAAEVDTQFLLMSYDDIEGSNANIKGWQEIEPMVKKIMGVEVSPKTGTEGKWGTPVPLNHSEDLFKRPLRYAILGYTVSAAVGAVAVRGVEPGQLRYGGPGIVNPDVTQEWFVRLALETSLPAIPVFSSQNVFNVEVELGGSESEVERHVTFICAQLKA
jgi:hypothetical protein